MKFIRILLFPFAVLYDVITAFRNSLYDRNLLKSKSFQLPVIVVGNLNVGGTGKSPQIEYLIRLLKDTYKVAVLSRGYKRQTKGFILVEKKHSAMEVGDEPFQFYKKFKTISVAVDANRKEGINQLINDVSPEVILLDDAFQHRKVKGSFYILLTKYDDLFVDDFLLPTGNLRENNSGAKRADMIVVTKCPALDTMEQHRVLAKLRRYSKHVFFTKIKYANQLSGTHSININQLIDYTVLLITGIANPKPLVSFLRKKGVKFQHLNFSDHHNFSHKEIDMIQQKFQNISEEKKMILTTEKDFMRLEKLLKELTYIAIESEFMENQGLIFNQKILDHIEQFK